MSPPAVRDGRFVFTSTLDGATAGGPHAATPETALARALDELAAALAGSGARWDELVHVGVHVDEGIALEPLAAALDATFPDRASAPAVRITPMRLPAGTPVHVQATAIVGARPRRIVQPGRDAEPVPAATVAGDVLVSSNVDGRRANGDRPHDVRDEIDRALANVCELVEQAGGVPRDLLHFWAFAADGVEAVDFTAAWLRRFPHAGDRPARKTFLRTRLPGGDRVRLQATAVLGRENRTNAEVPGVRHRDPLPMGARIGELFMSSGIIANAPDPSDPAGLGPLGATRDEQIAQTFATLERLMRDQGGSLGNVRLLGALVNSFDHVPALHAAMATRFAPERLPALQLWSLPMASPQQMIQLFATAVF